MRFPTVFLSLCLAGGAAGQSVTHFGFEHTPLGQAQLDVAPSGNLVVSNIGSSGQDGVHVDLLGSDYFTVMFDANGTQRGDFIDLRTTGSVGGSLQPVWGLEVEDLGNSFGVTMSPGPIAVQGARVLAWNDGVLVADTPVDDPAPGIIIIEVPPTGCDVDPVWPMGPLPGPFPPIFETWALFDLEVPDTIVIPSGFSAVSVVADRVAIAVRHDVPVGPLAGIDLVAQNMTDLELCAETLGWKHHDHTALGESVFGISNGFLQVANIGSSGLDGVCIELDPLMSPTTDNGLEVPLQPLPIGPGSSVELQARGEVLGSTLLVGRSEIKNQGGGAEVFADFTSIGGQQVCVMGLLDGQEVLNTIVPGGAVGQFQEPVVLSACGKLPPDFEPFPPIGPIIITGPQPPCYLWRFENDADLEIYNGFDAMGSAIVKVDELRLLAVDVPPVEGLERFDILGANLGSLTLADEVILHGNAWDDLGGADAGTNGDPVLGAWGPLTPGSLNLVGISNGLPFANAALFLSLADPVLPVPFKGGTLQAFPFLAMVMLSTDGVGGLTLPLNWPTGLPANVAITIQGALQDAGASAGVSLTNAVRGTSH